MSDDFVDVKARLEQLQQENTDLQEQLQRSESCLDQLQRLVDMGYWTHDLVTGEIWWSDHAFRILEVERRPVDLAFALSCLHPDDRQIMIEAMQRSAQGDVPEQQEYRVITASGKERLISNRWVSKYDEEGREVHRFGAHVDITEKRRVQAEREQLREQFHQAQKMEAIGRLAAGVAHDLSNLLCAIIGHTEIAMLKVDKRPPANAEVRQHLQQVLEASEQASLLTQQMLAISRQDVVKPRIVDVGRTLNNLEGLLGRVLGEQIHLSVVVEPTALPVRTDEGQLQQILMNLVVNARDAMPQGGDLVVEAAMVLLDDEHVSRNPASSQGAHVVISVSDTGEGMSDEVREHIFEPFFTTKPVGKGTGLGLASVQGLVEHWSGHITVHSERGHGSTFKLYFPLSGEAVSQSPSMAAVPSDLHGSESILVCEDSAPVLELSKIIFEGVGYEVMAVSHPEQAVKLVQEGARPDLLVTDVVMPELNGQQLAGILREELPALPVLFISGYTANIVSRTSLLERDLDLLEKPFTRTALLAAVRKSLDRAR